MPSPDRRPRNSLAAPAALLLSLLATGAIASDADPLFRDDDVLEFTIEAPIDRIMTERPDEIYVPGVLRIPAPGGADHLLDIGIRTRGEYRRQPHVCPFAPLRLNFETSAVPGTIFSNQDKIKLVTHCRDRSRHYEQTVLTEYLAYRILNLLTDISFRVRLAVITYRDTDTGREIVKPAFFIEAEDRLGERIGRPLLARDELTIDEVVPEYTNLTSVFQFLIGNTDFSPIKSRENEECCHNHKLFARPGEPIYSVPYDFDQSGLVDARHAVSNPRFRLRSVRERLYRGRCEHNEYLGDTLARFRQARGEIESLVENQYGLSRLSRRDSRRYIEGFYNIINDADRVESYLVARCL